MKHSKQSERLRKIVEGFSGVTVTALADLVADEFVFGEISRVSREAPVLILKHRERSVLPGGGANAIYNLAALGVTVLPVGVVGDDEPGRLLLEHFHHKHIATSGILRVKGHVTTTKTRILAGMTHSGRQQVVRIDREPEGALADDVESNLVSSARQFQRTSDALLISDYGYGAATPRMAGALRSGSVPVTLDSRYRMLQYSGVTAATPNEPEVEEALRLRIGNDGKSLAAAGRRILEQMKLEALLITRGREGMALFQPRRKPVAIPIFGSDQVTDVTGAGDTVIATFTAALGAGADAEDAARLANYAGGIVVMKRGTATVSQKELLAAIDRDTAHAHA